MLRLLGPLLVAALVLASGPAERKPLTKKEYVAVVRGAAGDEQQVEILFDDVVNYDVYPCGHICWPDERTAYGSAWVTAERSLRADLDDFADRFEALRPPRDVATLHASWISTIHGCAARLRRLEADPRAKNDLGASSAFEDKVAAEVDDSCFSRFGEIIPAFEDRGYVFSPESDP